MQYNTDGVLTAVNAAPRTVRQHTEEFAQEVIPQRQRDIRETINKPEIAVKAAPRTVRQHREEFSQEIIPQKPREIRETINKPEVTVNATPRTIRQPRVEFAQEIMSQKPKEIREATNKPEITTQPYYDELLDVYMDEPEIKDVREIGEEISNINENSQLPRDDSPQTPETSIVMNIDTNIGTGSDKSLDDEIARLLETDNTIKHDLPSFQTAVSTSVAPAKEVSVFDREYKPQHEAVVGRQAEKLEEFDKKKVRPRI